MLSFACAMGKKSRRLAPYRRADPHAAGTCPKLQAQGDVACSFGHISPENEPYVSKVAGIRQRCLQFWTSARRRRPRSVSPGGFGRIAGSGNGPFRVTIGSAAADAREEAGHELEQAAISYHAIRHARPPTGTIPLFIFRVVTIYFRALLHFAWVLGAAEPSRTRAGAGSDGALRHAWPDLGDRRPRGGASRLPAGAGP